MRGRMLITGGGGMVGRNLIEHPSSAEWTIVAPSRADVDLRDFEATRDYINKACPDVVVHAAGKVGGIQANIASPVEFLVENLDVGRNVVLAAVQCGVPRLLNLASSCIYPRHSTNPLSEDMILSGELEPTNEGYALSKIVTMRLCQYVNRTGGPTRCKTLVPCNLYGRYDKFDPSSSHLIPAIIHKLAAAKKTGASEVEIWGDGKARREFMDAADLADAVFHACHDFDAIDELMNIGVGDDHTIREYYQIASEVVGWSGTFAYNTSKPVGMKRKLLDVTRQRAWGWSPKTSLRDGLIKAHEFYEQEFI